MFMKKPGHKCSQTKSRVLMNIKGTKLKDPQEAKKGPEKREQ